tara:strand:+ start:1292 stop:3694 length:2403 start_codon:yes stop_codon:yes gene_type:complete
MSKQFLNYSNLSFNEIVSQLNDRLREDPEKRFDNFLESSVAQTMIEIFAASTDMTNYYIERRAEEQFLDTARLKSSIIQLSKILGYVIQRSIPAQSSVKFLIKGPLPSGILPGETITFSKYLTTFKYNGNPFILKKDYQYEFTADDLVQGLSDDFEKEISVSVPNGSQFTLNAAGLIPTSATRPIEILQGEILQKTFAGSSNTQAGQIFQKYNIDDITFSNLFGDEDLTYDISTGESILREDLTRVAVADATTSIDIALATENNLFQIDRRSVLTSQTVIDQTSNSATAARVCSIRTTTNQGIEILFADNKVAKKGVESSSQNLYVQYFSTKGLNVNETGVTNKKLTTSTEIRTSTTNTSVTDNIEWQFNSNIIAGADLESIDAIKLNAPALFYSLDRLITTKDYVTFLKSMTTPVNIKNALAWGEQEELENNPSRTAIISMFNMVFYTCVGALYNINKSTGTHTYKDLLSNDASEGDLISTFIEGIEYDTGGTSFNEQNYFEVFIKNDMTKVLDNIETTTAPGVTIVNDKIKKRSQLTLRNAYISPIVQQFNITGDVYVKNLVSINEIERRVNNSIYEFLNEQSDYAQPLYQSNITEIIESFPEVINASPSFTPVAGVGVPVTDVLNDINTSAYNTTDIYNAVVAGYANFTGVNSGSLIPAGNLVYNTLDYVEAWSKIVGGKIPGLDIFKWDTTTTSTTALGAVLPNVADTTELKVHLRTVGLSERNFYEKFMKHVYTNVTDKTWANSNDFKEFFARLNQQMKLVLRSSMKDESGNIVNYGFKHEIVQAISNLNFKYRF